jgi:metal-responsive CopG/Arc/MetJ family transcriptional regulator
MRIQFEFSDNAVKELDTLREALNAKSRGEVINHAIGVLRWLVKEKQENHKIIIEKNDNSRMEVIFPQLESLRPAEDS